MCVGSPRTASQRAPSNINASGTPRYAECVQSATTLDSPKDMSLSEQAAKFQMFVHVEGNGGWADRLRHLLLSGSALLKQDSGVVEWYEPLLVPGRHYVPVSSTFANLSAAIVWVRSSH